MKPQFNNNLWSIYKKTWFKLAKLPNLNNNLCVVTAYNPYGSDDSIEQNIYRNSELAHELKAIAQEVIEVYAGNEDFSYCEMSYIFDCTKEKAIALGNKWQQNAIFWIEAGNLYLVACQPIDDKIPDSVYLGKFLERTKISGS